MIEGDSRDWREKLRCVGLVAVSEEDALLPPRERGLYQPVAVLPRFEEPALPPHPAGYLIVDVKDGAEGGVQAIRQALAGWRPGELLELRVRRNPHRDLESTWWERDVKMWLPPAVSNSSRASTEEAGSR